MEYEKILRKQAEINDKSIITVHIKLQNYPGYPVDILLRTSNFIALSARVTQRSFN